MAPPRKYPNELRERALRLYRESDPKPVIRRLAEQLGVHPEALRTWIRQDEADRGERDDRPTTGMIEENRRLREGDRRAQAGQRGAAGRQRLFRLRDRPDPAVVMSFIDAHDFAVGLVLRVLGIASSTYYRWRARQAAPSRGQAEDAELLEQILKIRSANEFAATYGSPRVWLELRRQGVRCGRKRIERIMREHGLQGAHLRKGWKGGSTRQNPAHPAAPDLVDRDFSAAAPNRLWVAHLTRIPTGEGVLWLASVRDAFSNRVVGWKTAARADTGLALTALEYALWSRDVRAGQLVHHSDKGCQYTAIRFTQRLTDAGITPSTGWIGDSYDNALAENLWSMLKTELIYWPATTFATRAEAETAIFRYIDGWYNPRRIQHKLGGLSPDEYEEAFNRQQDPATVQPAPARAR